MSAGILRVHNPISVQYVERPILKKYPWKIKSHMFGKQFKCDLCEQTFMQKDTLRQHKLYRCKNADNLQLLKNREEKRERQKFACEMCDKVYGDKRNLQNHIRIIHEGKTDNFVCDVCSKSFSRITSLVAHKMLHTGEFKIF